MFPSSVFSPSVDGGGGGGWYTNTMHRPRPQWHVTHTTRRRTCGGGGGGDGDLYVVTRRRRRARVGCHCAPVVGVVVVSRTRLSSSSVRPVVNVSSDYHRFFFLHSFRVRRFLKAFSQSRCYSVLVCPWVISKLRNTRLIVDNLTTWIALKISNELGLPST